MVALALSQPTSVGGNLHSFDAARLSPGLWRGGGLTTREASHALWSSTMYSRYHVCQKPAEVVGFGAPTHFLGVRAGPNTQYAEGFGMSHAVRQALYRYRSAAPTRANPPSSDTCV